MSGGGEKDEEKNKEEEIFKLRKLAAIFKSECKKLKEENDALKRGKKVSRETEESSTPGVSEQMKNEYAKRLTVENSYKKLKNFTLMLEEKMAQVKSDSKKKYAEMEERLKSYQNDLSVSKGESEQLRKVMEEKDTRIEKLVNKMDQFISYLKENKGMTDMAESSINQAVEYKIQIKKLKEYIEGIKKTEEITTKERQQYRSMMMLCSQYKQKCKQLPLLENKVEILEGKIKELEIFKSRDKEKMKNISELKKSLINEQVEKEKLNEQLSEWINFAKLYIDKNAIDVESLKRSMQQIHEKYTHVNFTKTDLELQYRKLASEMEMVKQILEDKKLEVKIITNKNRHLEKMYEFAKRDYMKESSTAPSKENNTIEDAQKENTILEKSLTEYKAKYDFLLSDNEQKEKLIEELTERVKKYQADFEHTCLKHKNAETVSDELQLYQKEILILKEEIQNYKNRIITLEGDIIHLKDEWADDKQKYETMVNDLREAVRKSQFECKISGSAGRSSKEGGTPPEIEKQQKEEDKDAHNTLNALYNHLENLSSVDEIELITLRNENLYLKSKIEVVKIFYANQIKSYREAFLYILGWDIQIEQNDQDIFFILTSLFSTHDGKFIFIKSNGAKEKRSLDSQTDEERNAKRVKRQGEATSSPEGIAPVENTRSSNGNKGTPNDDTAPCEELTREPDEMTGSITLDVSKANFENTNMTLSSIVKGCKYNLLLHGHYGVKWNDNEDWKNHINKINTYPVLLSMSCIEEFNNIKAQYNNSMGKNSQGMLFKL
ncbi:conserved Plasmodium protein, unknown function [Plasmodium knowlesi strain H]|uniref:Uncharacterized protein n=3 Tax=Plasmodium knowlesi TaxID=5850 RepID=A0A5K1U2V2_PLAKH|nr:conserved Plasmodium protein, unknown function [Plasmodium knowlesi strain H]OTN68543.1 Uncharacterized protein PKNOH_S02301300 [Plasmodium knowlesi]CAA9986516.1 conserved Plasmodium protein, unknown function [Plasmodium knowlesi strain H]SBO24221.1 conserved Plasmodium protein, unknown function [Plasmodium knowlesi strain H]SBO29763.1 conserved Plasmodium protein, unknown function [Plasmodium knowlesi strain H]VVS75990.1 conserved Plasmodium protein, unknown function [Plasmodium knowlesi s|eukprot:XP_002261067.1 hypothetical protein, conserved in Plasmodium species [Plasmodium knowlesi strain H]